MRAFHLTLAALCAALTVTAPPAAAQTWNSPPSPSGAISSGNSTSSLAVVLKGRVPDDGSNKDRFRKALREWDKPLTAEDLKALTGFATATEHQDWLLHYLAENLLRAGGMADPRPAKIVRAEELFAEMEGGKLPATHFDGSATELAGLGASILPLLDDVLTYESLQDRYRMRVAVRALGLISGKRAIPTLMRLIGQDKPTSAMDEALRVLLAQSPDDATIDELAAIVARRDTFTQESIIRCCSDVQLPESARMRLYSHWPEFQEYGKHAVIRGLAAIDNRAAFLELSKILAMGDRWDSADRGTFSLAAGTLGRLKNSDPCAVLLGAFPAAPIDSAEVIMIALAERKYAPFIPVLEKRLSEENGKYPDDVTVQRFSVLAAGVMCRYGKDYDRNAAIVCAGIQNRQLRWSAYQAAGWLTDDATIKLVISQIGATEGKEWTGVTAVETLGRIGDKAAVPALMKALEERPYSDWDKIADALASIGETQHDAGVISEGQGLKSIITYLGYGGALQIPTKAQRPEMDRQLNAASACLKKHPQLIPKLNGPVYGSSHYLTALLDRTWTPQATPYMEKLIETDTTRENANSHLNYVVRREVSGMLAKKTGKQYTYVDFDGTVQKGGEWPN